MENDFLSSIRTSGSIQPMTCIGYSKRVPQNQKKNESPENGVAQIMTLFLPYLKESILTISFNRNLQHFYVIIKIKSIAVIIRHLEINQEDYRCQKS